ncbi:MAG: Bcr/CflA family drug resistance efflux transporter, partial [Roseovarius confluentis]
LSPSELGLFFGAPAVGYFTGNFLSGRFSTRIGINRMVFYGALANAIGHGINLATLYAGISTPVTFFGLMTLMGLGNGMTIPNATAGALSVRPSLAGTASGLAGFLMIGGGAGLSALAGALLGPGTGAFPLVWLMLLTAIGGILAITLVILRERQLGAPSI